MRLWPRRQGSSLDLLVVGLGNPGGEYERNRHNVGAMVADELVRRHGGSWRSKFSGRIAEIRLEGHKLAILKPETYMNDAGKSVGPARGAYKVDLNHVLVLHDEIDLPFGRIQVRTGGGVAGHNGLKSVRNGLGSADFLRVRVGVGRPDSTDPEIVSAYVLGRFREPKDQVEELIQRAADTAERVVRDGEAPT